jgi:Ca-activated chloride channel homolog
MAIRLALRIFAETALTCCLAASAFAADPVPPQQQPQVSVTPRNQLRSRTPAPRPSMRLDFTMILVPVSVTDATDKPVMNLASESFRVFEDDVEQKIVSFFREEGPVSVGFIFDASSSMKKRMDRSVAAIQQFLLTRMPGDEFFLVRFSDKPELVTGFTREPDEILASLSNVQPLGWTALHDAICLGVQQMKKAKNSRRALFVLTDGGDNNSRYSESEVRHLVQESDVRVFAIGLFERPRFLEKLAADTGGRAFWAHKLEDLPDTIERLSEEFRNQYVLGYSSKNEQKDGKYRKVRVELLESIRRIPLNLFWRRGYFAPPD